MSRTIPPSPELAVRHEAELAELKRRQAQERKASGGGLSIYLKERDPGTTPCFDTDYWLASMGAPPSWPSDTSVKGGNLREALGELVLRHKERFGISAIYVQEIGDRRPKLMEGKP
jgi:hypothetical protein